MFQEGRIAGFRVHVLNYIPNYLIFKEHEIKVSTNKNTQKTKLRNARIQVAGLYLLQLHLHMPKISLLMLNPSFPGLDQSISGERCNFRLWQIFSGKVKTGLVKVCKYKTRGITLNYRGPHCQSRVLPLKHQSYSFLKERTLQCLKIRLQPAFSYLSEMLLQIFRDLVHSKSSCIEQELFHPKWKKFGRVTRPCWAALRQILPIG